MDSKVRYVFGFLASKYQSWWRKRVDTDAKKAAEVLAFTEALEGYGLVDIKAGLKLLVAERSGCLVSPPPTAKQLVGFIERARGECRVFRRSVRSGESVASVSHARECLRNIKQSLG